MLSVLFGGEGLLLEFLDAQDLLFEDCVAGEKFGQGLGLGLGLGGGDGGLGLGLLV